MRALLLTLLLAGPAAAPSPSPTVSPTPAPTPTPRNWQAELANTAEVRVTRIVDGDTFYGDAFATGSMRTPTGEVVAITLTDPLKVRLYPVDAPEPFGKTLAAGKAASDYLAELLGRGTVRVDVVKEDGFGRWLGRVYVLTPAGPIDVDEEMVKAGHAVPYERRK